LPTRLLSLSLIGTCFRNYGSKWNSLILSCIRLKSSRSWNSCYITRSSNGIRWNSIILISRRSRLCSSWISKLWVCRVCRRKSFNYLIRNWSRCWSRFCLWYCIIRLSCLYYRWHNSRCSSSRSNCSRRRRRIKRLSC
jgi:hypothetical protein